MSKPDFNWWVAKPRRVSILNDTIGWATPWCVRLKEEIERRGDICALVGRAEEMGQGDIAFFLGCTRLVPVQILLLHRHNLVVHASALPKGRGFSPLKWQICAGENVIPITLFEASEGCDTGPTYSISELEFGGHELLNELQESVGAATNRMCLDWLASAELPHGSQQVGEPTTFGRRTLEHQRLDPNLTLAEQFNTLRTVDNLRFPAFFDLKGHRYELRITKLGPVDEK